MQKKINLLFIGCVWLSTPLASQQWFSNPLLPSGADPWAIEKDGWWYYTHTTGRNLVLYKTKNLSALKSAERKVVWQPPDSTMWSKGIWAPEIHWLNGKWYFYFAADNGKNENHRLYVLENSAADPMKGDWVFKGKLTAPTDRWAIDGSVFQFRNRLYLIWSGWEGSTNGRQDIYIARLKDPLTVEGDRVRISSPLYDWERHGKLNDPDNPPHVAVNEGPQALEKNGRLFIVYSASGCWTDHYSLGLLRFTGTDNLLDSSAWHKSTAPVFQTSPRNRVFAPGHNSFFRTANGEDWILYHANSGPGKGCGRNRSPRAQRFGWKADGTPDFGVPVGESERLLAPGSNKASKRKTLIKTSH